MLQQTQVARVEPRYHRFLERFATPSVCAAQPVSAVIEEWAGLGYNRRAVNLHRATTVMVDQHGGRVPERLEDLLALPGVGPYTARAVLVFAHERDVGVVDTNVGRLLARWSGRSLRPAEAQRLADALVPDGAGWRWNQALFDLGAGVCRARNPDCAACPVSAWCSWRGIGDDPASGSAATGSRQSRFDGSDRQGRGRLVDALRSGTVARGDLASVMGWPGDEERAARVAATLQADGLAMLEDGTWRLP